MQVRSFFATVDWPTLEHDGGILLGSRLGERLEAETLPSTVFFGLVAEVVVGPDDGEEVRVGLDVTGPGEPNATLVDFREQHLQRLSDNVRERDLVLPALLPIALEVAEPGEYRFDLTVNGVLLETLPLVVYPRGAIPPA